MLAVCRADFHVIVPSADFFVGDESHSENRERERGKEKEREIENIF